MILWISLMSTVLATAFCLGLNSLANWSQYASEQTRLDALSLSICHSRLDFLQNEIESPNKLILRLENVMSWAARACLLAPPGAKIKTCQVSRVVIRRSAKIAGKLMHAQDIARKTFPSRVRLQLRKLTQANSLESNKGRLHYQLAALSKSGGLRRETLSKEKSSYEALFKTNWPRRLLPTKDFNKKHRYHFLFLPKRKLIGLSKAALLKIQSTQVKQNGKAKSQSQCRLLSHPYRVERKP